jgi:uncharacterized membrane protein
MLPDIKFFSKTEQGKMEEAKANLAAANSLFSGAMLAVITLIITYSFVNPLQIVVIILLFGYVVIGAIRLRQHALTYLDVSPIKLSSYIG